MPTHCMTGSPLSCLPGPKESISHREEEGCQGDPVHIEGSLRGADGGLPQSQRHVEKLDQVLVCAQTGRAYTLQKPETKGLSIELRLPHRHIVNAYGLTNY